MQRTAALDFPDHLLKTATDDSPAAPLSASPAHPPSPSSPQSKTGSDGAVPSSGAGSSAPADPYRLDVSIHDTTRV